MPLSVGLAGYEWEWRLAGDAEFGAWIERRPWCVAGGVAAAQWPSNGSDALEYVRRLAYGADMSVSNLRVVALELRESPHTTLTEWLGVRTTTTRELAIKIAEDLAYRPTLFVARIAGCTTDSFFDFGTELIETCSKLDGAAPAFVVLHGRGQAPIRGTYSLDTGWPRGLGAECLRKPTDIAWRAYMHIRVAWEVGGEIEDALVCAESGRLSELARGDEEGLERALNGFATAQFAQLSPNEQSGWLEYVSEVNRGERPTVHGRAVDSRGLVTPFPWLTRALLLRSAGASARALRHDLVCRPLVAQILMTCFAVEAQLHAAMRTLPDVLPPDDAVSAYSRYCSTDVQIFERMLYPREHPARPSNPWDFASMGAVLRHGAFSGDVRRAFESARILRNALSHGHYVGWKVIERARDVFRILR